jgi:hypothetical protein
VTGAHEALGDEVVELAKVASALAVGREIRRVARGEGDEVLREVLGEALGDDPPVALEPVLRRLVVGLHEGGVFCRALGLRIPRAERRRLGPPPTPGPGVLGALATVVDQVGRFAGVMAGWREEERGRPTRLAELQADLAAMVEWAALGRVSDEEALGAAVALQAAREALVPA